MRLLLLLVLVGCVHPQVSATAASSSKIEAQGNIESTATVKAHVGRTHIGLQIVPAADGGTPTINLAVDGDPVDLEAGAQGSADAGVQDASSDASTGKTDQPASFWTPAKWAILFAVAALAVAGFLGWKLKPKWLSWLWPLLGLV